MTIDPEVRIAPFFLPGASGPLFCIHLVPAHGAVRGQILYLHPFAEEMHKSRRMVALQARRLAATGYAVLRLDLSGCGDSWGDFGDARWGVWLSDATAGVNWLRTQTDDSPIFLWGLRLGATLAVDLAARLPDIRAIMLWQPVTNGELFLNQFLRIKLAREMLTEGRAQTGVRQLHEQLKAGKAVEVGGYLLDAELVGVIGGMHLERMAPPREAVWIEVGADAQRTFSPASQAGMNAWIEQGCALHAGRVEGEPFWITQEITECPALLGATVAALDRIAP